MADTTPRRRIFNHARRPGAWPLRGGWDLADTTPRRRIFNHARRPGAWPLRRGWDAHDKPCAARGIRAVPAREGRADCECGGTLQPGPQGGA